MAHKRKDTVGQHKVEYKKHLRPWEKRVESQKERRAAKQIIANESNTTMGN